MQIRQRIGLSAAVKTIVVKILFFEMQLWGCWIDQKLLMKSKVIGLYGRAVFFKICSHSFRFFPRQWEVQL